MQFNPSEHRWSSRESKVNGETEYFITNPTHQLLIKHLKRDNGSSKIIAELYELNGRQLLGPKVQYEVAFNSSKKHIRTTFAADMITKAFGVQQVRFDPVAAPTEIEKYIKPFAGVLVKTLKECKPTEAQNQSALKELYNLLEPHKRTFIDIGAYGTKRQMRK